MKLNVSHKLAIFVSVIYASVLIINIISILFLNKDLNSIMDSVNTVFMVVLSGYFVKAGAENVVKIKTWTDQVEEVNENEEK